MDLSDVNAALGLWAETQDGRATLINLSENHSFRIDLPDGRRYVLRVHRAGYQSARAIESELEWVQVLRREGVLPVPQPLAGRDGKLLQMAAVSGTLRHAVLFGFERGREPSAEDDLAGLFGVLGRLAGLAHEQAARFTPAPGFTRPVWNAEAILDTNGIWGDWRAAPGVEGEVGRTLRALDARLRADLAAYGGGPDRFGLIHADMRLANLLVDGDKVTLIDFDDCGFGWFMYDFAAAISFHEADPRVPELRGRWLEGYGSVRVLSEADVAIIDAMVLLRRMALLAWIGSHAETGLAQAHAGNFARVTADLARGYLA